MQNWFSSPPELIALLHAMSIDFGLGSRIRYADGVTPCMDGCVLIADGPPIDSGPVRDTAKPAWTDNGVDITLPLRCEDMERLLQDPLLLPAV